MRSERSRDMYHLPIVNFSLMNGDLRGITSLLSEQFYSAIRGKDLFCTRRVIYELYRNFTSLFGSNLGRLALSWGQ